MRQYLLLFFVIILVQNLTAQKAYIIKGHICDSLSLTDIPYATVSLTKPDDSTFIKKMAADLNGQFEMQTDSDGVYEITIESIGYSIFSKQFTIEENQKMTDLGQLPVIESVTALNSVTVTGNKPLVKVEADKITYNTESDPESKTLNALDMLRKVPLVSVDGDDNVSIKGKSNFKIHINGRPSSVANNNPKEFLRNLPASSIKNIEVITSPGAKYDAEGVGGILNIITVTKLPNGYSGSVNAGVGSTGVYRSGLYFAATLGKFSFSTNLTGSYRMPQFYHTDMYRENYSNSDMYFTDALGNMNYKGYFSYGTGEISYEIDTLNLISGSFEYYYGTNESEGTTTTETSDINHILNQSYAMNTLGSSMFGGPSGNLNYQHLFKNNKERILTISYLYNSNPMRISNTNEISDILNFYSMKQKSDNLAKSSEHTFQTDYVQPFKNKSKLESGIKYIFRSNNSATDYFIFDPELTQYVEDTTLVNDFNQTQNIEALYTTYSMQIKKFNIKAGIRLEHSLLKAVFELESMDGFSNESFEYVPSGALSYAITDMQSINLAYNMRLQRPDIWFLNPYVSNTDPKNIRYGNPNLEPERYHIIDLSYNFFNPKLSINISLSESLSKNGIDETASIDTNNVVTTTYFNINNINQMHLSTYVSWKPTTKLNFSMNGDMNYQIIRSNMDQNQKTTGWGGNAYGSVQYTISEGFKLNAYSWVFQGTRSLHADQEFFFTGGFNLSKDFFKKKLSLALGVNNLFRKEIYWGEENFDNDFYQRTRYYSTGRMLRFNITWRFGETDQQVKKTQRGINNDDKKSGGNNTGGGGGE
jgi:outer membrane receptor protein involved in Fe transport